jgi:uncharacterized protein YqeY
MNTNKKITKAMRFEEMANIFTEMNRPDLADFCNKQIELLAKKNTTKDGEKKMTATQVANERIKNELYEAMADDEKYTITEMIKNFPCVALYTNQKVSALVRQMVDAGKLYRYEIKGMAYFGKKA